MCDMPSTTEPPELLTLNELADYLRVGRRTAWQLVNEGAVPAVKVRGQWRILRAEVDAQLGYRPPEMREPGFDRAEGSRGDVHGKLTP
jgi:excisionase family DNA binding protein